MRCEWEKSTQGDVSVWVQVSTHTVLFPYFPLLHPLPCCITANQTHRPTCIFSSWSLGVVPGWGP